MAFPNNRLRGVTTRFDVNKNHSVLALASAAGLHEYLGWKLAQAKNDAALLSSALYGLLSTTIESTEEALQVIVPSKTTTLRVLLRAGVDLGHFGWYARLTYVPAHIEG